MDRVVLVTGGGRGIGAATSLRLASQGCAVAVNYARDAAAAEDVVRRICDDGGRAVALQCDVSRASAISDLFDGVERELGPVWGLVNNAGLTGRQSRLDETDEDTIRRVIDVDLVGLMLCAREGVRRMSTAHGGQGGVIVNVSSGASTIGSPGQYVWYAAAKGGVDSFTRGLALEVAGEGIRVVGVAPGIIDTTIHADGGAPDKAAASASLIPLGRAGRPEEVASAIAWLMSDDAGYVDGTILRVAGGR